METIVLFRLRPRMSAMRLPISLVVIASLSLAPFADADTVDFSRDVYAVLQRSCFECHGPDRQEAGLRLDIKSEVFDAGVIDDRSPDDSELVRRIGLPRGHDEVMPVVGDPLSMKEVTSIRQWIADGSPWPDDFVAATHWSYVAPTRPNLPAVSNPDWPKQPVDHFVMAKLDEVDWQPSPTADRSVLLRRLHLDLIGLPPTINEVTAFDNDSSDDAVERVVDDLMSRPQFGERWARPWLDLARYADSHGFQRDDFRDLWAYRDWVIRAINDDMPFDQFTIEQIAGDLLPGATQSQRIATGFHRCAPTNVEAGSLPEETRIEQVLDRVNTTATVWLGSTMECAQCHDHKFDAFTTKEYYELLAFFNNTPLEADLTNPKVVSSIGFQGPSMAIADSDRDARRAEWKRQRTSWNTRLTARRKLLQRDLKHWASTMAGSLADTSKETHTKVVDFESKRNTDSFTIRDDGAILLVGSDPPPIDTYTVTISLDASNRQEDITAIRLNALTDDSLPGDGPGRGDPKRTNFVLNEFTAAIVDEAGNETPIVFSTAEADFSQTGWDVSGAIDGNAKTGWAIAPQFGRRHHATFGLNEPLRVGNGITLRFRMQQNFGSARTLGCFSIEVVDGDGDAFPPNDVIELLRKPADEWTSTDRKHLIDHRVLSDSACRSIQEQLDDIGEHIEQLAPDTTQVMVEMEMPRPSYVFDRGDYRSAGDPVTPGTPACLHPMQLDPSDESPNRLTLARWLVDPTNPLVARVTVNRWWMELFGHGLVRTPEDYGIKGDRPTHPELLDWLAVDFVESGWSMKHVLKTIVLSATYQQSSGYQKHHLEEDDTNRRLARGPSVRMDAETIRDNALAVSGLISLKSFGPPIRPYQPEGLWVKVGGQKYDYTVSPGDEKYRRGVYVVIKRGAPYPSFVNFDADNRFSCTVQRSHSNTPLQALTLLNDPVYVEAAKAMAVRAATSAATQSIESTIVDEFRRTLARRPTPDEVAALVRLHEQQTSRLNDDPGRAGPLSTAVRLPDGVAPAEFATWYSVSTTLLNLHETITKE